MKIEPTVGRIVHVHLSGNPNVLAGIICAVHERGINVAGFDQNGTAYRANGVRLVQEGEDTPIMGTWAEWMPYQKGQAAKTESLEAKLAEVTPSGTPALVTPDGGEAPISLK